MEVIVVVDENLIHSLRQITIYLHLYFVVHPPNPVSSTRWLVEDFSVSTSSSWKKMKACWKAPRALQYPRPRPRQNRGHRERSVAISSFLKGVDLCENKKIFFAS